MEDRSAPPKPSRMHMDDSVLNAPVWPRTGVRNHLSNVSGSRHPMKAAPSSPVDRSGAPTSSARRSRAMFAERHAHSESDTSDMNTSRSVVLRGARIRDPGSGSWEPSPIEIVAVGFGVAVGMGVGVGVKVGVNVGVRRGVAVGTGVGVPPEHASDTANTKRAAQENSLNMEATPHSGLDGLRPVEGGGPATDCIRERPGQTSGRGTGFQQFLETSTSETTGQDLVARISKAEAACISSALGDANYQLFQGAPLMVAAANESAKSLFAGCLEGHNLLVLDNGLMSAQQDGWPEESLGSVTGLSRNHPELVYVALGVERAVSDPSHPTEVHSIILDLHECLDTTDMVGFQVAMMSNSIEVTPFTGQHFLEAIPGAEVECLQTSLPEPVLAMIANAPSVAGSELRDAPPQLMPAPRLKTSASS